MKIEDLPKFSRLVGSSLSPDELHHLTVRCTLASGEAGPSPLTFYRLMDAVESFAIDSNQDPAILTLNVLSNLFPEQQAISVKELDNFLRNLRNLSREETHLIINEIRYLQSIKNMSSGEDISLLIRDCCERHAK
jgi:hypothetical protein